MAENSVAELRRAVAPEAPASLVIELRCAAAALDQAALDLLAAAETVASETSSSSPTRPPSAPGGCSATGG